MKENLCKKLSHTNDDFSLNNEVNEYKLNFTTQSVSSQLYIQKGTGEEEESETVTNEVESSSNLNL